MKQAGIPIIILAGSDRSAVELPARGRGKHPLAGYKGIDVRIDGRPLLQEIVDRLEASGRFSPIYIAGPAAAYADLKGAVLVDADGSFGENIRTSLEFVRARHPGRPMGFTVCDILPDPPALRSLMADYDRVAPCDLWFPMVQAPEDRRSLGASAWKPEYRVVPQEGETPVQLLPGHLAVVDPEALRLEFVYRLFQLAYRTRNRPIGYRRRVMVRGVLLELLVQDLRHVLGLRLPTLTWTVLRAGIRAAGQLRDGTILKRNLEDELQRVLVPRRHRKRHPERRVLLPIVDALSLALDIDTEEEARAMGGDIASRSA